MDHLIAPCSHRAADGWTGTRAFDNYGVEALVGDTVRVIAWGAAIRLVNCGSAFTVTVDTPGGNTTHDSDVVAGRPVSPGYLAVACRGSEQNREGNRTAK